mmetsp:Transcript_19046/g.39826  ORF Transcript_19046/g.39826 Transcript_19046/m.39826 type:complete len:84 (-) Transcript_19046:131-382(-)
MPPCIFFAARTAARHTKRPRLMKTRVHKPVKIPNTLRYLVWLQPNRSSVHSLIHHCEAMGVAAEKADTQKTMKIIDQPPAAFR